MYYVDRFAATLRHIGIIGRDLIQKDHYTLMERGVRNKILIIFGNPALYDIEDSHGHLAVVLSGHKYRLGTEN